MRAKSSGPASRAPLVISIILVIAALRLGREVLMPFALAVLISFLLAPLVILLQRKIGRVLAVVCVTLVSFVFVAAVGWFMVQQAGNLAEQLPERTQTITHKIRALRSTMSGKLGRASQTVTEITKELKPAPAPEAPIVPIEPSTEVVVVKPVVESTPASNSDLIAWIEKFIQPLSSVAVIVVFVVFILIYYDDLRDRILRLMGTSHLNVTTQAIDDAAKRVSRYLMMQSLINTCHGTAVATGLYILGVPSPLFFGLSAALLRFIPYLGPVLAAAMPITLCLAVFEGWSQAFYTAALFIFIELVSNNVLEPWLYGSSTGLSPVAIIGAAVFWSWMWGPMGLVLSAPLTVCVVVLGKHVARLNFLSILLGDQPVLEPKDRVYQRMLVMDQEGALEIAEAYLEEHTLAEVFDDVLIPALFMSEIDRHEGNQEEDREKFILDHMRDLIEELSEASRLIEQKKTELKADHSKVRSYEWEPLFTARILCLPAQDEADELAGFMLAELLKQDGYRADTMSASALAGEMMESVEKEEPQIACISALPPMEAAHARYLYKRLRTRFDDLPIVVGLWNSGRHPLKSLNRAGQDELLKGATRLADAREIIGQLVQTVSLQVNGANAGLDQTPKIPCAAGA